MSTAAVLIALPFDSVGKSRFSATFVVAEVVGKQLRFGAKLSLTASLATRDSTLTVGIPLRWNSS
ncbi:MAG TPA: hypothetical protein VF370_06540 [Candidatus Cryosericum sp.]